MIGGVKGSKLSLADVRDSTLSPPIWGWARNTLMPSQPPPMASDLPVLLNIFVICYLYLIKCTWWAKANDSVDLSIRLSLLSGGHTEFSLFKQKLRCSRCLLFPHRHANTISFWQKISRDIGDWFPLDLGSSPSPEMKHYLCKWYDCMRNGCLQLTCWLRQALSTWWCTTIYPADSHILDA